MICFVASHGDAFELFEFAEVIFDEMAPFEDVDIERARIATVFTLRDDDFGAAPVQFPFDRVDVERLVGDQALEGDALDQRRHPDRIVGLPWHQDEFDQIAQRIGQRQDFGRPAAYGTADGLAAGPPFAPWPCR